MAPEKFVLTEVETLSDGRKVNITYSDTFYPLDFLRTVINEEAPLEQRKQCALRLLNSNVATEKDLRMLITGNHRSSQLTELTMRWVIIKNRVLRKVHAH